MQVHTGIGQGTDRRRKVKKSRCRYRGDAAVTPPDDNAAARTISTDYMRIKKRENRTEIMRNGKKNRKQKRRKGKKRIKERQGKPWQP